MIELQQTGTRGLRMRERRRVSPASALASASGIRAAADAILEADARRSAALRSLSTVGGGELPDAAHGLAALAAYRQGQGDVDLALGLLFAALRRGGIAMRAVSAAARVHSSTVDARIAASPDAVALLNTPVGGFA